LVDGLYVSGRPGIGAQSTAEMLRGYDLITLVVVVPALAWASTGTRRASTPARLIAAAALAYLGYTYGYYLFGNGFTDLLLVHVLVFAGSVVALFRALLGFRSAATVSLGSRAARGAAVTLAVLAVALGGMWTAACVGYIATGELPAGSKLVETDQVVQLGIVLDLAILVPLYATAAAQLWRGRSWGLVLGAVTLLAGILHQLSYLAALLFQDAAGVPGAVRFDPLEPVIVLIYLTGALLLVHAVRHPDAAAAPSTIR
jgi:hypothetical protein